jgi:hypothetical protein
MSLDLKSDVFEPVAARIAERRDSLLNIKRFPRTGIEGWFKVEILAALGNIVKSLQNVGPDLLLADGTQIEIKAATDFHKGFFLDPIRKYGTPSLFLGDGADPTKLTSCTEPDIDIVGFEVFSDGKNNWLLGLVRPRVSGS